MDAGTGRSTGNFGIFYKGEPNDVALKFEEFHQVEPFATRFVVITHMGINMMALLGIPAGKDHRDIVQLLTPGERVRDYVSRQGGAAEKYRDGAAAAAGALAGCGDGMAEGAGDRRVL